MRRMGKRSLRPEIGSEAVGAGVKSQSVIRLVYARKRRFATTG
jgi:hypothetical protein